MMLGYTDFEKENLLFPLGYRKDDIGNAKCIKTTQDRPCTCT